MRWLCNSRDLWLSTAAVHLRRCKLWSMRWPCEIRWWAQVFVSLSERANAYACCWLYVLVCVDFRLFLEIYIDFGSLVKRECKMFLCLRFLRILDQKKWNIKIGPTWTIVLSGNLMLPGIYFLECFVLSQNVTVDGCSLNSRAHQVWGSIMSFSSLEVSQIGAECVHVRRARVSAALDRSAK